MHIRLLKIHPFIDENVKISRLVMNLILLQKGYLIANIKGDSEIKMYYSQLLENILSQNNTEDFILFIAQIEKESLEKYISIIGS